MHCILLQNGVAGSVAGFPINVPVSTVEFSTATIPTQIHSVPATYNEGSIISSRHIGESRGKVLFLGGVWTSHRGSGGMLPRDDYFLNIEVKSINLVHFESNMKRSMDTSLNNTVSLPERPGATLGQGPKASSCDAPRLLQLHKRTQRAFN